MSQQDLANVMMRFRNDVTEATNALIYILYGINLVHLTAQGMPSNSFPVPDYPPLKVLPQVIGNTSLFDRTAPNGPIEQLAFKAWVTEVYDSLWERIYRTTLTQHFREITPRGIRLEAEVIGDLRLIRNDLVHTGTAAQCSTCKVLRWFKAGDPMHMRLRHVLDFLNQMGWISDAPCLIGERAFMWLPSREMLSPTGVPRVASVRAILYGAEESEYRNGISVVFEDGVHALVRVVPPDGKPITDGQWMNTTVDESGDILVPPTYTLRAKELYPACFGPTTKGPGVFSPPFRLAR